MRNDFAAILLHLQSSGFRDIAGARVSADIPIAERLINEVVSASLPSSAPVRQVLIHPEDGDQFSVRLTPRTAMLPPITLKLDIERQPEFPQSPVLVLRMKTLGGLFGLASAAFPLGKMLPPGVRLEGERILIDLHALAAQRGMADLLQHVTTLTVSSQSGRVLVHVDARA